MSHPLKPDAPKATGEPSPEEQAATLSRFQAQKQLGLFATHDMVMLALIVFLWITLGYWSIFGNATVLQVLTGLMFTVVLMMAWAIALIYRCLVWILDVQSIIHLMPQAAARIVAGYYDKTGLK